MMCSGPLKNEIWIRNETGVGTQTTTFNTLSLFQHKMTSSPCTFCTKNSKSDTARLYYGEYYCSRECARENARSAFPGWKHGLFTDCQYDGLDGQEVYNENIADAEFGEFYTLAWEGEVPPQMTFPPVGIIDEREKQRLVGCETMAKATGTPVVTIVRAEMKFRGGQSFRDYRATFHPNGDHLWVYVLTYKQWEALEAQQVPAKKKATIVNGVLTWA